MNKINTFRLIEAEGFRDGSQGVNSAAALEEINKHFGQLKEQEKIATSDRIRTLEGKIQNLEQRKFDADHHWADLETQTAGMPPQMVLPFCAVVFSALVVAGETVFLAPVMDGFGIAEPMWQHLLAAVIVLVCSGLFEITKQQRKEVHETSKEPRNEHGQEVKSSLRWGKLAFLGFINLLAMLLVSVLGWWRAEEMIFAASAQPGSWQNFLSENAALTRIVVMLLTVSLPVFVAMAFEWGISGLRYTREWRKTRRDYRRFTLDLANTKKSLESESEKTESRQQELEEMREEWKQTYLQKHELGQKVGAQQLPVWQVVLKIAAVVLLLFVGCLLADPLLSGYISSEGMRYLLYGCLILGVGGVFAVYAVKAWDRPDANQLYKQKAVNWREPGQPREFYEPEKAEAAFSKGAGSA